MNLAALHLPVSYKSRIGALVFLFFVTICNLRTKLFPNGIQMKGLRRNDDAMKYQCWYQTAFRYLSVRSIIAEPVFQVRQRAFPIRAGCGLQPGCEVHWYNQKPANR